MMPNRRGSVKGSRLERRKDTPLARVCPCWILNRVDPVAAVLWMELHSIEVYGARATTSPSVRFLAETIGTAPNTITRAIADLESIGALLVWRRPNRTSLYRTRYDDPSLSDPVQETLPLDEPSHEKDTPTGSRRNFCDTPSQKLGTNHTTGASSLRSDALRAQETPPERRVGLTTRDLVGSFSEAWTRCGLGRYTVTGKDRAVLNDHLKDFASVDEARETFEERIRWAMKRDFWEGHLCLRSVLETIANQMSLSRAAIGSRAATSGNGSVGLIGQTVRDSYREIALESGFGLNPETAAILGATPLRSSSTSGSTGASQMGIPDDSSPTVPLSKGDSRASSDEPDPRLGS